MRSIRSTGIQEGEVPVQVAGSGEALSPERLLEHLKELEPRMKKRQPKKSTAVLEVIEKNTVPQEFAGRTREMSNLIRKYKFYEAQVIFESLVLEIEEVIA